MSQDLLHTPLVTDEQVARYREDGVVHIRGAFTDWVERLRGAAERAFDTPGGVTRDFTRGGSGRFRFASLLWETDPDVRGFVFDSPAGALVGALMESSRVHFFKDQLFVKEPGTSTPTPWHHDLPYWCVKGDQVCSVWLALDLVTEENGRVEYIRGSHRWPQLYQPEDFSGEGGRRNPALPQLPDIEAHRGDYDIVSFDLEPGDCAVFHGRMIHGAPGSLNSLRRRRGFSTRWLGDDVTYDPERPGVSLPHRDPGLAPGAPIGGSVFPEVWRRG
ncbi:phytanoyl-CoA dioxygenase family protein [Muricoccus aerilatus]|uniref:phytanoyl-CoA dioxygenase family protein n=1 Tax=Muricoccus aerilatus TaxID=452982 RepID=UPI000AF54CE3|nr:phytanoyl-CoA dioxygenase family protein [Roseomonas aerilata]